MIPIQLLICPLCARELQQNGPLLRCPQRHTFDIASDGYVNLMRKQLPGDTREMLHARRGFLEQGYYRPLSEHIHALAIEHLPVAQAARLCVLDAGCGEGYYLGRLLHDLARQPVAAVGIDISKEAVRMAAKRYREAFFAVASIKERFVFRDEAFHLILNIFAPRNSGEFARVLLAGGLLIVVIPGEAHLARLRSSLGLLNIEEHKQQHVIEQLAAQFALLETRSVRYSLPLRKEAIRQVVMMTPNYWHISTEIQQKLENLEGLETEVEFICLLLRRR